jgi:esterase/lipase superfamily enzyme
VRLPQFGSLLLAAAMVSGCASPVFRTIDLMPAPAVFAGGAVDPFLKDPPPVNFGDFGLLYATDRKPAPDPGARPFYTNQPGFLVRLGSARVEAGQPGLNWDQVRRISLSERRSGHYPLKIRSVEETGVVESTRSLLAREPEDVETSAGEDEDFAARVDARLAATDVKDVFIYVHGFRVAFDEPVLVAAEFWHFLGYRGVFIAYAWPSTQRMTAYLSDLETAKAMARNFRLFLTYLRENTQVERIHIIAYSAGSRLVVRALEQLAMLNADAGDEALRKEPGIGNVIIVGGDISLKEFASAATDGMLRVPERTIVYLSSSDRALIWSRRLFRRKRLGEMWVETLPDQARIFLRTYPSLELVDVTDAAGSTTGNGHAYFRDSPWVSSDILTVLARDPGPDRRGLERTPDRLVWHFPPDYIERLQRALLEMKPPVGAKGGTGEGPPAREASAPPRVD